MHKLPDLLRLFPGSVLVVGAMSIGTRSPPPRTIVGKLLVVETQESCQDPKPRSVCGHRTIQVHQPLHSLGIMHEAQSPESPLPVIGVDSRQTGIRRLEIYQGFHRQMGQQDLRIGCCMISFLARATGTACRPGVTDNELNRAALGSRGQPTGRLEADRSLRYIIDDQRFRMGSQSGWSPLPVMGLEGNTGCAHSKSDPAPSTLG